MLIAQLPFHFKSPKKKHIKRSEGAGQVRNKNLTRSIRNEKTFFFFLVLAEVHLSGLPICFPKEGNVMLVFIEYLLNLDIDQLRNICNTYIKY